MSHVGGRRRAAEPVYLNVYDLSPANDYLWGLGLGAFHSGLEVYGTEYSFGAGGGVFSHSPKQADGARFRERVYLGDFHGGHRDVETVVGGMRGEWAGSTYNVLTRNCNSFCDALCRNLLGHGLPGWVNRLAYLGSCISCLLPSSLTGAQPVPGGETPGGGAGGGGFSAIRPGAGTTTAAARAPPSIFSGSGRTLATDSGGGAGTASSGAGPPDSTSIQDRRERAMRAALERAKQQDKDRV